MSLNAATIEILLAKGLTGDDLLAVARAMEVRRDPTAAERMARHRANKGATRNVTRNPPNDNSSNPPEELPQEANASLPQGAKRQRCEGVVWPCPAGVDPSHWRDFLAARKKKRCVTTQSALDGVMKDLAEIADDEWPPGRLVAHAAAKGWASINDPRKSLNGTANGQSRSQPTGVGSTERAMRTALASIGQRPVGASYPG